jgi:non-homologous end joining protein Ku
MQRKKMTNKERAKIFAPFDALKGFKEALKEEEVIKIPKATLSEDQEIIINNTLNNLEKGMMVEVIHYSNENEYYLKNIGIFTKIDLINKSIFIVKNRILVDNIIDIKIMTDSLDF